MELVGFLDLLSDGGEVLEEVLPPLNPELEDTLHHLDQEVHLLPQNPHILNIINGHSVD